MSNNKKITDLTELTSVEGDDLLEIVDDSESDLSDKNKKVKIESLPFSSAGHLEQDVQTLTDGATISWDMSNGGSAVVTLGGNRTLNNPTNVKAGGLYRLIVKQDATGGRTLAFSANYKFPGNVAPFLSSAANNIDMFEFYAESTTVVRCINAIFASG